MAVPLTLLARQECDAWYPVGRNQKIIKAAADKIFAEKQLIMDRLAERDAEGNFVYSDENKRTIKFQEGKQAEADQLWNEIQAEEMEIEVYKFSASKFGNMKLSSVAMAPLMDIIITE